MTSNRPLACCGGTPARIIHPKSVTVLCALRGPRTLLSLQRSCQNLLPHKRVLVTAIWAPASPLQPSHTDGGTVPLLSVYDFFSWGFVWFVFVF